MLLWLEFAAECGLLLWQVQDWRNDQRARECWWQFVPVSWHDQPQADLRGQWSGGVPIIIVDGIVVAIGAGCLVVIGVAWLRWNSGRRMINYFLTEQCQSIFLLNAQKLPVGSWHCLSYGIRIK